MIERLLAIWTKASDQEKKMNDNEEVAVQASARLTRVMQEARAEQIHEALAALLPKRTSKE